MFDELLVDFTYARTWPEEITEHLIGCTRNGFFVNTNDDEAPLPYNTNIRIDGDDLVLEGEAQLDYGQCIVRVPKKSEDGISPERLYTVTVEPDDDRWDDFLPLAKELQKYGVRFRAKEGQLIDLLTVQELRTILDLYHSTQLSLGAALVAAYRAGQVSRPSQKPVEI